MLEKPCFVDIGYFRNTQLSIYASFFLFFIFQYMNWLVGNHCPPFILSSFLHRFFRSLTHYHDIALTNEYEWLNLLIYWSSIVSSFKYSYLYHYRKNLIPKMTKVLKRLFQLYQFHRVRIKFQIFSAQLCQVYQTGEKETEFLSEILTKSLVLNDFRWRNWIIRGIFTWILIGIFGLVIYGGPLALMMAVSSFDLKGRAKKKERKS